MKKLALALAVILTAAALFGCAVSLTGKSAPGVPVRPGSNDTSVVPAQPAAEPVTNNQPVKPDAPADPVKDIGLEAAKSIALEKSELSPEALQGVVFVKEQHETDDGIPLYEISFYVGSDEYEYEIHASTGEVMSFDRDIADFEAPLPTSDSMLTKEAALKIALARVPGAAAKDAHIHLERDDGKSVYEGEIHFAGYEYDFEIDALTGRINEWDEESMDDDD